MPLEGEVPRRLLEPVEECDPEKEAREAEEKGSDEEDSGPDAEGEGGGDLVILEAGGVEEKAARAKAAAMARARRLLLNVVGPEAKGKVRRLWNCVRSSFYSPPPSPYTRFPSLLLYIYP